jgi:hypothetical protein
MDFTPLDYKMTFSSQLLYISASSSSIVFCGAVMPLHDSAGKAGFAVDTPWDLCYT